MRTGVLLAIASALAILGLSLGLAPGSATNSSGETFSCGSPWNRDTKEMAHQKYIDDLSNTMLGRNLWDADYRQRCDDALGTRGVFAWLLLGSGALLLGGVALTRRPQASVPAEPSEPADND